MDWNLGTHRTAPRCGHETGALRDARFLHAKTSKACLLLLFPA